jgi:hypothetical protein
MINRTPAPELPNETAPRPATKRSVLSAALVGLMAATLCFGWLYFRTHYLYNGNWTSVYYTGATWRIPPELASEHIYRFPGVVGYDAQLYHLIAHDPLFKKGFDRYLDDARIRYRRILVPGLAALLSFGNSNWVDPAYVAVVLASIYLGAFWLARWSDTHGLSTAWGFLFLAMPAALVTMLLMIVDGTLAALTVGAFFYAERQNQVRLFLVLACAALVREIGFFLVGGYCLWLLFQRKPLRAIAFGTAAIPAFAWLWFVQIHTRPSAPEWLSAIPFLGLYRGIVGHWIYRQQIFLVFDFVAIAGMLLGFVFAGYYLCRRATRNSAAFMVLGFLLLGIFMGNASIWPEVNSFGRVFTPVLLFVAATGMSQRNWWTLAPVALVDFRIGGLLLHQAWAITNANTSNL